MSQTSELLNSISTVQSLTGTDLSTIIPEDKLKSALGSAISNDQASTVNSNTIQSAATQPQVIVQPAKNNTILYTTIAGILIFLVMKGKIKL